jgi:Ca2+-binding EF-hand superfamily protein
MSKMPRKSKQLNELRDLFNTFDTDGSGSITMNELELVLTEMGVKVSSERLAAMIHEVDGEEMYVDL